MKSIRTTQDMKSPKRKKENADDIAISTGD
jgi:hypothetical protein